MESCIVMAVMCLVFLGIFQVSRLFAAKEFVDYAAACGARARTVGFNDFMTWKTARVGLIPNAGKLTSPSFNRSPADWDTSTPAGLWAAWSRFLRAAPASEQANMELSRIPLYLGSESHGNLPAILDYDDWDTTHVSSPIENDITGTLTMEVTQSYPLRMPLHRAFYMSDTVELTGKAQMGNHYPLYLAR